MIRSLFVIFAIASSLVNDAGPAKDVRDATFPARVWVAAPTGQHLVCADDYPNGAIGSGTDGREIKLRSADRDVSISVTVATHQPPVAPNTTLGRFQADVHHVDVATLKAWGAIFVDQKWWVKVTVKGPGASRSALESAVASLAIVSLNSIAYQRLPEERVVYDGRWLEGEYLPFYEFSFVGSKTDRTLVRVVGFPSRLNPVERVLGGKRVMVGTKSGLSSTADGDIPYVSWNPVPGTSVTVFGPGAKLPSVIATANRISIVPEGEWRRQTKSLARVFPDRTGWSRCTRA